MAKVINETIADLNISWENRSGEKVEEFIKRELKNRCGYLYRTTTKIGDYYYIYGFMDIDSFYEWQDTGENELIQFRIQLPNIENDTFAANLETNSNTTKLVNLGNGIKVNLRYTSTATNPTTQAVTDTYNDGTLVIMRSANGSAYSEVARVPITPLEHTSTGYTTVDITNYLADGDNKIRLRVEDNVTGAISNNVNFKSIINTTLKIESATDLSQPLSSFALQYYIQGQVAKTLNIKLTQNGTASNYTFPIGDNTYVEVPYNLVIDETFESGIKTVEAWLSVDDTTLESEHITNQFYLMGGSTDEAVVIINNASTTVANYANTKFFDFTLYNRASDVDITVTDGTNVFLAYKYTNCQVGTTYSFWNTLEIESTTDYISAIVIVKTVTNTVTHNITVDNSEDFNPTADADFVLNPKTRSNSETNPATILNAATGETVTATFNNKFKFQNDGWVSDDNGINVLRVPGGNKVTISYDPIDTLDEGTTIEIDFKTYNIFNEDEAVLRFCSYASDGLPLGFELKALEACYMTTDNRTKRDQDIMFQENTRTHVAINIVPNLANSGINYIRIFVNGTINREMTYNNSDIFRTGINNIVIGSDNVDIDIYGIRVYKKGLSASNIRQDYMSSLPTMAEKIAYKSANNILSSDGTISYDKANVIYNTLVWTGSHPEYVTGKVKFKGSLKVNLIGDTDHSGDITNLTISGQGSSSRGYWRWNHQYELNSNSVFTDGNGETHTSYRISDDVPWSKILCSKLNWASSMQSHKIGTTALYTDLWKSIVGGNSITKTTGYEDARVSIYEKPFLYFTKETATSQPVFAGLVTFGAAKDDDANFGYDEDVFPNYLLLEGSDNGMPLTLRQVPWIDSEVTYNEKEEYFEYAGGGSWDYDKGNLDNYTYFKNATNFVYQHSPRLKSLNGNLETLNANQSNYDTSYQYWNKSNGDVYRFDYISDLWVDAGITNTTKCVYHYTTEDDVKNGLAEEAGVKVIDTVPVYSKLNLVTQTSVSINASNIEATNTAFINWRISDFKSKIGTYYNTTDVLFEMGFIKLIAASDNWCKNTYEYLDPVTFKICMAQDDMDTVFLSDNVGRKVKPYYVEEHDMNGTNPYFNGNDNVFFCLMEQAFSSELRGMVKSILNTMGSSEFGGSVDNCLQKYFFSVQEYFPTVAYNETARILYEAASVAQKTLNAAGDGYLYTNGTPAISQSLGDQLQAEKQWWNRRRIYMASYASSTPFDVRSGGSLGFRSLLTTESARPSYTFGLKPYIWLYPKVGIGQTLGVDNTRVHAGNLYNTVSLTTDGNTDTFIYGANYFTDFGEFGDKSIGEAFNLSGAHLTSFSADSRKVASYQFRPTSMTINCPVLKTLSLYGCSTLSGQLALTNCKKLETLELRGTRLTSVLFPETETLKTVNIPNVTALNITACPNITSLYYDSISNLRSLTTDNATILDSLLTDATGLQELHLNAINITETNASKSNKLYNLLVNEASTATGYISLNKTLSFSEKVALIKKYGNIDNPNAALHIVYTSSTQDTITITGDATMAGGYTRSYSISYSGNDFLSATWTASVGTFTVSNDGTSISYTAPTDNATVTLTCVVKRYGKNDITATKNVVVSYENPITAISVQSMEIDCTSATTVNIPITITPADYNIDIYDMQQVISGDSGMTFNSFAPDYSYIKVNVIESADKSHVYSNNIKLTVTDTKNRVIEGTKTVYRVVPITGYSFKYNNNTITSFTDNHYQNTGYNITVEPTPATNSDVWSIKSVKSADSSLSFSIASNKHGFTFTSNSTNDINSSIVVTIEYTNSRENKIARTTSITLPVNSICWRKVTSVVFDDDSETYIIKGNLSSKKLNYTLLPANHNIPISSKDVTIIYGTESKWSTTLTDTDVTILRNGDLGSTSDSIKFKLVFNDNDGNIISSSVKTVKAINPVSTVFWKDSDTTTQTLISSPVYDKSEYTFDLRVYDNDTTNTDRGVTSTFTIKSFTASGEKSEEVYGKWTASLMKEYGSNVRVTFKYAAGTLLDSSFSDTYTLVITASDKDGTTKDFTLTFVPTITVRQKPLTITNTGSGTQKLWVTLVDDGCYTLSLSPSISMAIFKPNEVTTSWFILGTSTDDYSSGRYAGVTEKTYFKLTSINACEAVWEITLLSGYSLTLYSDSSTNFKKAPCTVKLYSSADDIYSWNISGDLLSVHANDNNSANSYARMFAQDVECTNASCIVDARDLIIPTLGSFNGLFHNCKSYELKIPETIHNAQSINVSTTSGFYASMFEGANVIDASNTTLSVSSGSTYTNALSAYMYYKMFKDCKKLTKAPKITATIAYGSYCMADMFNGCTSLTTVPDLSNIRMPNSTTYTHQMDSMFNGCTSLTNTTGMVGFKTIYVPSDAMYNMFAGCTKLTKAFSMDLVTTIYGEGCFGMYNGCTGITTGNSFSNLTSVSTNGCYRMFYGCKNMTKGATSLSGVNTTSASAFYYMYAECSKLTSAPALPSKLQNNIFEGMFKNCTSLTTAPALPATALSTACYKEMFSGCTKLTSAPALPATTIVESCYESMFEGCSSLVTLPALDVNNFAKCCFKNMFKGTAVNYEDSTYTFYSKSTYNENASKFAAEQACYGMYEGCTQLKFAPQIWHKDNLASNIFSRMFYGCSSLYKIWSKLLVYNTTYTNNWVYGVYSESNGSTSGTATFYYNSSISTSYLTEDASHVPATWRKVAVSA